MTPPSYNFFNRVRREARRKRETISLVTGGRERLFEAYDWDADTFIFERAIFSERPARSPVLIVPKKSLYEGGNGYVMTATSGNHSVAAIPLLTGRFWNLPGLGEDIQSEVMNDQVLCCNIVGKTLEISQRAVAIDVLHNADNWLRGMGWPLDGVVIADRLDSALEHYRRLGQEWRIKPLAWSPEEMKLAIMASRARISSDLNYYHSVKGVHFLTYSEFCNLVANAERDFDSLMVALEELVGTKGVHGRCAMRESKFRNHHEIELFGVHRDYGLGIIVPQMEKLYTQLAGQIIAPEAGLRHLEQIRQNFRRSLDNLAFADETSEIFISSLYKHLTGAIYQGSQDQVSPAFDDHKTALPGMTFQGGKSEPHPGCDYRTIAILNYVHTQLSFGESLEYANVYELRDDDYFPLGRGPTREVEYKTNLRPMPKRLIEKRLAHQGASYANYMLARVEAFQSLGISFGNHHLLSRQDGSSREVHYFVRQRYQGQAYGNIGANHFRRNDSEHGVIDFPEAILAVAALLGSAASQTLVIKRFNASDGTVPFGQGKEIIEFGYDVKRRCEIPIRVRLCSIRGTLGWPDIQHAQENLDRCFDIYFQTFADTIRKFWLEHALVVTLPEMRSHFVESYRATTRRLYWNYTNNREDFHSFDPGIRGKFKFQRRWRFALWALEEQQRQSDGLIERFDRFLGLDTKRMEIRPVKPRSD